MADRDGSGSVSLSEALLGFARVKERLQGDERIMDLLQTSFGKPPSHDPHGIVERADFDAAEENPVLQAQLQHLGVTCSLGEIWEAAQAEAKGSQVTLEGVLEAYLSLRDPRHGDRAAVFFKELVAQHVTDGRIVRTDLLAVIDNPETVSEMLKRGIITDLVCLTDFLQKIEGDPEYEQADTSTSSTLAFEDALTWFLELRDMVRQRDLEEHFFKQKHRKSPQLGAGSSGAVGEAAISREPPGPTASLQPAVTPRAASSTRKTSKQPPRPPSAIKTGPPLTPRVVRIESKKHVSIPS